MKKIIIGTLIFFIGFIACFMLTHGSLQAQSSDSAVMNKLNEIAKGQEELLALVNALKEDIHIVKIRVTQLQ